MKFCFRWANRVLHLTIAKIFKFLWKNGKLKNWRVPTVTEPTCLCFALVMLFLLLSWSIPANIQIMQNMVNHPLPWFPLQDLGGVTYPRLLSRSTFPHPVGLAGTALLPKLCQTTLKIECVPFESFLLRLQVLLEHLNSNTLVKFTWERSNSMQSYWCWHLMHCHTSSPMYLLPALKCGQLSVTV